jgi:hypothetical protein
MKPTAQPIPPRAEQTKSGRYFCSPAPLSVPKEKSHSHAHAALDAVGMYSSMLCAIHCLVAPIVLVINPIFSWLRLSRKVDMIFLTVAVVVGLSGCLLSIRNYKNYTPLWLMLSGLAANSVGRFAGATMGPFFATSLILVGPLLMGYALWMDRQLCRHK